MIPIYLLKIRAPYDRSGLSLIAVILLMVLLGISAVVGSSLIGTGNIGTLNSAQNTQALALAQAGLEWYLEQLQNDTNWADQVNVSQSFAGGTFDITIGSTSAKQVTFTSSGSIAGVDGLPIRRRMTTTVQRFPQALLFALFQGNNPASLQINTSTINGDVWSGGSVVVSGPPTASTVTGGKVYVPTGSTVTGGGTYTFETIASPTPAMPFLDATPYTTLMNGYDTIINGSSTPGADCDITNQTLTLTGNTIVCGTDFATGGNATITGTGTIAAKRDMFLHSTATAGQTLTVTPSGGEILFLAQRDMAIGITTAGVTNNPTISIAASCRFYARNQQGTQTTRFINIGGTNTTLNGAKIYARRRLRVGNGADVLNDSLLYVDRQGNSAANNWIDISGGTGTTQVAGSILSVASSTSTPNLRLQAGAVVTGLVYSRNMGLQKPAAEQYLDTTEAIKNTNLQSSGPGSVPGPGPVPVPILDAGTLELNGCTVTGTVVANQFRSGGTLDRINAANITYSAEALPPTIPDGFATFMLEKPTSWDGL